MKIVDATVFVGVYGSLRVHPWLRDVPPEEDAYSLFTSRASAMGWSSTDGSTARWGMNDAGQDWGSDAGSARVAWFQVGTDQAQHDVPVRPLLACVHDTLARVGALDLHAVQMVLPVQTAAPGTRQLLTGLSWFSVADPAARVAVRVTLDSDDDAARWAAPDVLGAVQQAWTAPFRVEDVVRGGPHVAPEPAVVDDLWMGPDRRPVTFECVVPEWTLDAVGWLAVLFVEGCRQTGVRTTVLLGVAPSVV